MSVLDEAAVEKALGALHAKEVQRTTFDPAKMGEALTMRQPPRDRELSAAGTPIGAAWSDNVSVGGGLADLVEIGIGAALAAWRE